MKTIYSKTFLVSIIALIGFGNFAAAQHIAAGGWHSLAICSDGTVRTFGENATGQLGNGNNTDQSNPATPAGLSDIVAVAGGGDQLEAHSLALKNDGTVWSWGSNLYGGLGNGGTSNTNTPGQVLVLTNITAISAGGWHSVALKSDSTVWTWGWNIDGQLGDSTVTDRSTPAKINGLSNVIAIAAGTYHVLALKSDGTVWAWGDNVSGQIGNGTTTDATRPVQVSGLSNVKAIAAGRFFSLAVKNDGTVWTWGENLYGQLGDGTTTDRTTPVQVSGLTGITSATAATGAFHCIAVKNDNTVWSWGRNSYGNLGDGTVVNKSTPVQMTGMSDVVGLAAGTNFSLLYKSDGTFWGCGRNASGQLGDGTVTQQNTATQSTLVCAIYQSTEKEEAIASLISVKAFPNPSLDGIFSLQLNEFNVNTSLMSNAKIEVYNALGEKVYQTILAAEAFNSVSTIDLSQQAKGIYIMTLQFGQNIISRKLVKQ